MLQKQESALSHILALTLCLLIAGCGPKKNGTNTVPQAKTHEISEQKNLLIYCGITMIAPMTEIASIIERQEGCHISITKGGSGNLLKSILHNQTGDMYLPGSSKYYATISASYPDLILDRVFVGHNKAALMVQKGNPLNLTSDLNNLTNPDYAVIIGNPDSGSIGKETKAILSKAHIFEEVVKNTLMLTTDSKDILKAVKNKHADIIINWYATATWDDNARYVDIIEIDPEFAQKKELFLSMLKYTKHPKICEAFMQLASSAQGREIFKHHGLYFE